jgi:hypothetical protein
MNMKQHKKPISTRTRTRIQLRPTKKKKDASQQNKNTHPFFMFPRASFETIKKLFIYY